MFKINMVLSDIVMYFSINMSGVEDNVENLQSYLDVCCVVMVFESCEIDYFSFCHSYLDLSHDFNYQIFFHSHFFTAHTSLGNRKCLIGMQFDRKPDNVLIRTLYKTRVAANVILKVREDDAINDALFAPLSNYREGASKLTDISNKTLSCIKAESEKVVLAPRSDGMKPSDIKKCKI